MPEEQGGGEPARVEQVIDLGHYRRVTLRTGAAGESLLAFVPKSQPVPTQAVAVRPRRFLVYANERLAAVAEPDASAPVAAMAVVYRRPASRNT